MSIIAFIAIFIAGFVLGVIVMAMLPDDEPPTDWTNTGC